MQTSGLNGTLARTFRVRARPRWPVSGAPRRRAWATDPGYHERFEDLPLILEEREP